MRLVTWNCRVGGFRKKAKHIAPLRPDVLVVQEVEPLDGLLLFAGEHQPTFRDRVADPAYPRRAVGVFSYTETKLAAVDLADPMYAFRRYEAHCPGLSFQVVGVWTSKTDSRERSYRQAHEGIRCHRDWIKQRPTVICGDFNDSASVKSGSWRELLDLTEPLGLVSAYHEFFSEPFGQETRPTHFHGGRESARFHVDYLFLPADWARQIKEVQVGTYADWHAVSDHVPVIVDLRL